MNYWLLIILLLTFGCKHNALSESPKEANCGVSQQSYQWNYCFTPSADPQNKNIIYYFHGGGGSQHDWQDPKNYTETLRQTWKSSKKIAPAVVSVSLGQLWVFSDRIENGKQLGSYDDFVNNFVPEVEKKFFKIEPEKRIVVGESMGGFNAAVLGLRLPGQFSRMALLCPGVLSENIFSEKEMQKYIDFTGANKSYTNKISSLLSKNFDSAEQYKKIAPQALLRDFLFRGRPPQLFVSCGESDEFGFFKESKNFVDIALNKKFDVVWKPVKGKHCSLDVKALADFLVK